MSDNWRPTTIYQLNEDDEVQISTWNATHVHGFVTWISGDFIDVGNISIPRKDIASLLVNKKFTVGDLVNVDDFLSLPNGTVGRFIAAKPQPCVLVSNVAMHAETGNIYKHLVDDDEFIIDYIPNQEEENK